MECIVKSTLTSPAEYRPSLLRVKVFGPFEDLRRASIPAVFDQHRAMP
jgi:hypothetical protein